MGDTFLRVVPAGETPTGREFSEAQLRIERVVNPVLKRPWNQGVLIQGVVLETGYENWVEHGLGRAFISWTVCDPRTNLGMWRRAELSTADVTLYVPIVVSTPLTIDLWVF